MREKSELKVLYERSRKCFIESNERPSLKTLTGGATSCAGANNTRKQGACFFKKNATSETEGV